MTAYAIELERFERHSTKTATAGNYVHLGLAAHYLLTKPHNGHTRITISSSTVIGTPECYAFATSAWTSGEGMGELSMSQKGTLDHEYILSAAGYIVLTPPRTTLEALKAKDYDLVAVLSDAAEEANRPFLAEALRLVGQGQLL